MSSKGNNRAVRRFKPLRVERESTASALQEPKCFFSIFLFLASIFFLNLGTPQQDADAYRLAAVSWLSLGSEPRKRQQLLDVDTLLEIEHG